MSFLTYRVDLNEAAQKKLQANDLFTMTKSAMYAPATRNVQLEKLFAVDHHSAVDGSQQSEPSCLQTSLVKFYYRYDTAQGILGHLNNSEFQTYNPPYPPSNQSNWTICRQDEGFVIYTSLEDSNGSHWRADITNNTVHLENNTTKLDDRDYFKFKSGQISPILKDGPSDSVVVQYDPSNLSPLQNILLTSNLTDPNTYFKIAQESLDFIVMVNN